MHKPPTNSVPISLVVSTFRSRFDALYPPLAVFVTVLAGHALASLYRPPQNLGESKCCV